LHTMTTSLAISTSRVALRLRKIAGLRMTSTRVAIAFIFAFMIISSPVLMFANPAQVLGVANRVDSSSYHSTLSMPDRASPAKLSDTTPSALNQNGDFTAQAPLSPPAAYLSTDLVGSKSIYEIVFVPTTTGTIKKVEMTFPAGTDISGVNILDRIGLGGGTLTKSGTTLTFTVNNAVSVPAGTFIRLEMVNVKNPQFPSPVYKIAVTTRDPANMVIDGTTESTAYIVRQIAAGDIANGAVSSAKITDGAITSTKPAESFMKRVFVNDNTPGGDAVGWTPNGALTQFTITEPAAVFNSFVSVSLVGFGSPNCHAWGSAMPGRFIMECEFAPSDFTTLSYVVENLPAHVIS
jgi:hypothetical protein